MKKEKHPKPITFFKKKRVFSKSSFNPRTHDELGVLPLMKDLADRKHFRTQSEAEVYCLNLRKRYPKEFFAVVPSDDFFLVKLSDSNEAFPIKEARNVERTGTVIEPALRPSPLPNPKKRKRFIPDFPTQKIYFKPNSASDNREGWISIPEYRYGKVLPVYFNGVLRYYLAD